MNTVWRFIIKIALAALAARDEMVRYWVEVFRTNGIPEEFMERRRVSPAFHRVGQIVAVARQTFQFPVVGFRADVPGPGGQPRC